MASVLSSCSKENRQESTLIKGSVKEVASLTRVSNVEVKLVENNCMERFGSPKYLPYNAVFIIDTITVDDQGEFEMSFPNLNPESDYCLIVYNDSLVSDVYKIGVNQVNSFEILVRKLGFMNLNVKNITRKYKGIIGLVDNYLIRDGYKLEGDLVDTLLVFRLIPGNCKLSYHLFINEIPDTIISSSYEIVPTETLDINFTY